MIKVDIDWYAIAEHICLSIFESAVQMDMKM